MKGQKKGLKFYLILGGWTVFLLLAAALFLLLGTAWNAADAFLCKICRRKGHYKDFT